MTWVLNHIKTIGGRVMGSAHSRTALRTHIHALIFNQGLPSIFLTLNPADIHSPVALYFAGVKLDLDTVQAEQLMDTYKRAEIIASHPVATAKFFHTLISNILDTMIIGGVLGRVKAYFGTVESQGRGGHRIQLSADYRRIQLVSDGHRIQLIVDCHRIQVVFDGHRIQLVPDGDRVQLVLNCRRFCLDPVGIRR
ncbi:unnamed protein product [Adineta ricciae]|uniref:Helitron helicase-like domain-containing protein n=1 Tax=Adineta ricciae TaxID=249248 RepID=A0A815HZI5_ADIRI|nr:unnamed protein product [Adineta ricciae]